MVDPKIIDNYHAIWPRCCDVRSESWISVFFLRFELLHNHDISTTEPFQPGASQWLPAKGAPTFWISQRHCQHRAYLQRVLFNSDVLGVLLSSCSGISNFQTPSIVPVWICTLPSQRRAVLTNSFFRVSSANATVCSACTIQGSMQRHRIWPVSFFCHSSGVPRHRDHLVLRSCFWIQLGVCHSSMHQLHLRMRKNSFNFLSQSHLWESRENLMWGWKPDTKMCFPKMKSYYMDYSNSPDCRDWRA